MKKYSLSALVAAGLLAGGLSVSSASAADLGGNCCADLEERIAELEATTARKGNRKVSLTISGWVGEQVMWWDDDLRESNVYVGGLGTTLNSHFKLTGQATISPGWYAGYVIHVEVYGSETLLMTNQNEATGPSLYDSDGLVGNNFNGISTLQSFWFIKSDHLGKLSVGKQSQASDNTALLVDGSGSLVPANYVPFDYGGFFLRDADGDCSRHQRFAGTFRHIDCNGLPLNNVRYDLPTFAGFSVSASWGEDDFWDVAARYAGEHAGFKVAVAAAYFEDSDEQRLPYGTCDCRPTDTEFFQIGGYIQHVADRHLRSTAPTATTTTMTALVRRAETLVRQGRSARALEPARPHGALRRVHGRRESTAHRHRRLELWGVGVVQEIDAAAMSVWLSYRNIEADDNGDGRHRRPSIDFQYVKSGALINF